MFLSAYVKNKTTKQAMVIERDSYTSKDKFAKDLRANGFFVIRISNNQDIAAQNYNFITFAELKKYSFNPERIAEIEKIEL